MKNLLIILLLGFFWLESKSQDSLPAPSLQLITPKSDTSSIILEWSTASNYIIGFVIEKKEGDNQWLIIGQTDSNERTYVDKNVSMIPTCYRIRSFGNRIFSTYSNIRTKQSNIR
jgi:hypothetical protein